MYPPRLITPPATEPITESQLQEHLGSGDHDDRYLGQLIAAARKVAEDQFELAFITQSWRLVCDDWWAVAVELPRPPHQAVDSVEYLDNALTWQTLDDTTYYFDPDTRLLQWVTGATIPELASDLLGRVRINFTSGFSNVPESAVHAMLMLCGHFFENREALVEGSMTDEIALAFSHLMFSVTEDYL